MCGYIFGMMDKDEKTKWDFPSYFNFLKNDFFFNFYSKIIVL